MFCHRDEKTISQVIRAKFADEAGYGPLLFQLEKGIFYYTADGRIDFRQLVKDLAKEFKMRIEMHQVGVRDEAKLVGGLGVCGRLMCFLAFEDESLGRLYAEEEKVEED